MDDGKIDYQFISANSKIYNDVVKLRYKVFFEPNGTSIDAIFDELEDKSFHLAAVYENHLVGYIRLTIEGETARISQFVVAPDMRGKRKIAKNLINKIIDKAKEEKVAKVYGEIRLHVAKAAEIYGFTVSKEVFPSPKTGIPHRRIERDLKQ